MGLTTPIIEMDFVRVSLRRRTTFWRGDRVENGVSGLDTFFSGRVEGGSEWVAWVYIKGSQVLP